MSKICPACHAANDSFHIFCTSCGKALDSNVKFFQDLEKHKKILEEQPDHGPTAQRFQPQHRPIRDDDDDDDYIPHRHQQKKNGCYVATAVYGSYDCPQVWTLRRFRDGQLASSLPGRTFIRLYYAVSPALVRRFGRAAWFQKLCRAPLDRLVQFLRARGVEDTPYQDTDW